MALRASDWQRVLPTLILLTLAGCSTVPNAPSSSSTAKAPSAAGPKSSHPALPPAGSGRGGYYLDDGPGDDIPDGLENVPDAVPQIEPYAKRGNNPYTVFGTRYVPLVDDQPYKRRGYGSWYGKKFHGQKTSSGELYDMYKMTAASPVLPIPSYARVTNLSNGKQVIVRVNDRGPFRSSRIIDLSYTAALKLGYIGHGSAELEVERLLPQDINRILAARNSGQPMNAQNNDAQTVVSTGAVQQPVVDTSALDPLAMKIAMIAPEAVPSEAAASQPVQARNAVLALPAGTSADAAVATGSGFYLQFGAYAQMANAETMRSRLSRNWNATLPQLKVEPLNNLYRIYSGPYATREEAASAAAQAQQAGIAKPFVVQR